MKKISILLIILCFAAQILSCQTTENNNGENISATTTAGSEGLDSPEAEETVVISSALLLPETDYEGRAYTILGREANAAQGLGDMPLYEFYVEEEIAGDLINEAVYKRTAIIEENYNIKLRFVPGNANSIIPRTVRAGTYEYDIVWGIVGDMSSMATNGNFLDLNEIPHIDTKADWWFKAATDGLTIGGKNFVNINYTPFTGALLTHCGFFNQDLLMAYGLERPYALVKNGTWTYDKFVEMTKQAYSDLNGDGVADRDDLFGHISSDGQFAARAVGMGIKFLSLTENNEIELGVYGEKSQNIVNMMLDLVTHQSNWFAPISDETLLAQKFSGGEALFYSGFITDAYLYFRNMDSNFGILPLPKYDVNQENYITTITNGSGFLGIPNTIEDEEFVGLITEAMAIESYVHVYPTIYDTVMQHKIARDDESKEMFDILVKSIVVDLGRVSGFGGYSDIYNRLMQAKSGDLTSYFERVQNGAMNHYSKIVSAYLE